MRTHKIVRRNAPIDPQIPPAGGQCGILRPGCDMPVAGACDVSLVAGVTRAAAAGTSNQLTMAPLRTDYFQPLSEKLECIDNVAPGTNRRAEISAVLINDQHQEPFSSSTASAVNTSVVLSDFLGPAFDGFGKPVGYGIYTQANLTGVFQYTFWNPEAVAIDLYAVHFGNPLSVLPPGMGVGQPFN